ncbi:MAG: glycosyltransferase family 1 protein [Candidatus Spechtbacterales bacterium]
MIKVGIDCHKLEDKTGAQRAGIGRHTYRLIEEISHNRELSEKFRFYLYFKGHIPDDIPFLENDIFVKRVAKLPFFIPFFRPSFNIFFHIALPLYIVKDRVNVTFFPSFMLPAFFPPDIVAKSLVVLTNDIYYEYTQGTLPKKYKIGYQLFANWAARYATQITTQTYASREEISGYFNIPKEKIVVVPLGADIAQTNESTVPDAEKQNYIFYLGQAFPRRHLKETIQAFEIISPEFPEIQFIAVGVDKYNPPVIDKLVGEVNQKLGDRKIHRFEFVSDERLGELYKKAKLFCYISSSEAMGLPPLEALASGTAPVVADTPTTREIFGDAAFFVKNPDDPKNIAETLREALQSREKRENIVRKRKQILSKYTWKGHAEEMVKLFEKVALK